MTGTPALIADLLGPVLAETAFDGMLGTGDRPTRGAYVLLCASTRSFRERHPSATAPLDPAHPDGCIDLVIEVGDDGRLDAADLETMPLDDGLVGQPIEDALPVLAERLREVLRPGAASPRRGTPAPGTAPG